MSHSHAIKGNWGSTVKTSAGYNWRNSKPNFNCDSGPTFIRIVNAKGPQGRPKPEKAWVTRINWRILKNSIEDLDPLVSLVQELVTPSKTVNASGEEQVEDISPTTLEAAAILTKVQKIKSVDKGKRYKKGRVQKHLLVLVWTLKKLSLPLKKLILVAKESQYLVAEESQYLL
ncbi:hypothetical protein Tco_0030359 [Tanacetum coccineum]